MKQIRPVPFIPLDGIFLQPITPDAADLELLRNTFFTPSNLPISHYISARYLLKLIESGNLFLRRIDQYPDDPTEGLYPSENLTAVSSLDAGMGGGLENPTTAADMRTSHEVSRLHTYIHCWYSAWSRSDALWASRGDEGKGFCILSTAGALEQAVRPPQPFTKTVGKVTYRRKNQAVPVAMSNLVSSSKDKNWEHENECRLKVYYSALELCPADESGVLLDTPTEILAQVNIADLIQDIVPGPKCEAADIARILDAAAKAGVRASSLSKE